MDGGIAVCDQTDFGFNSNVDNCTSNAHVRQSRTHLIVFLEYYT